MVYPHTRSQFPQSFYNDFASLPSVNDYELFDPFPSLVYGFPLVPHRLVQAGRLLLLVDRLVDCQVGFPL